MAELPTNSLARVDGSHSGSVEPQAYRGSSLVKCSGGSRSIAVTAPPNDDSPAPVPSTSCSQPSGFGGGLVIAAGCVLLLLSVDRIVRGLAAIRLPSEAMYGESILYGQAARLIHGQALYQPLDQPPFTVTAYMPLYYALVAGLRTVAGPGFAPGRILSFAAGLSAAILVGHLAAQRAADRRAGIFAGVLFLGLAFPGDYPWFAFYKEDMLGVVLSLGAVATLGTGNDRRRAVCAGTLAGLAFLTKQTFIAASLAGFVWFARRDRTSTLTFVTTLLVVAGVPCLLLTIFDPAFLANTIGANLNPYRAYVLVGNLEILGQYQAVPLVLALLPVLSGSVSLRNWARDPLVIFWFASLLLLPVTLGKVGSNWNYWIELAGATAPLATAGIWVFALRGQVSGFSRVVAWSAVMALLVSFVWLPKPVADLGSVVTSTLHPDERQATEFAGVVDQVRMEPRVVLGEPLDVLALADRDIYVEPYIFSILYQVGEWDPSPVERLACTGQIGLLVLDHPLEGPDWEYQGYTHWPAPLLAVLRQTMQLEETQARLYLYIPNPRPGAAVACRDSG